jgi:hypothetical protein
MALYRFSIKYLSRRTGGAPVDKAVAYLMREQDYAPARAHLQYVTRTSPTTRSREDLVHTAACNLPPWAAGSPATFFAAAERYERANGRVATKWEIALPRELTRGQQIAAARDFLQSQFGDRHPYVWALHESRAADGQTNPHLHVLFSARTLDGIDREPAHFFQRYNPQQPALGGAQKDRFFVARAAVPALRQAWADVANWHLERAGQTVRIDPRNLRAQGVDRDPESRLAPYHATQAKYRGTHTPEWQATLQARATRQVDTQQEEARARQYWEQRKETLGLAAAPPLDREAFVARVAQASREAVTAAQTTRAPRPDRATLTEHLQTVQQALHAQQTRVDRLYAELLQEQHRACTGTPRSLRAQQRIDALLQEPDVAVPVPPRSARLEAPLIGHRHRQIYHEPGMKHYGDVHPTYQVWFWSHAEAHQAGYRRAQNDHDGRGAERPMTREAQPSRIAGRLLDKQTIGGREYALLSRADGSQALVPWHPSMTARLGQHATLAHHPERGGWQVLSLGLDRERLQPGAQVRLRDDHEEERTR